MLSFIAFRLRKLLTASHVHKEHGVIGITLNNPIQNPLNCGKPLKLIKLQRKDEISLSVNVTKVEKID